MSDEALRSEEVRGWRDVLQIVTASHNVVTRHFVFVCDDEVVTLDVVKTNEVSGIFVADFWHSWPSETNKTIVYHLFLNKKDFKILKLFVISKGLRFVPICDKNNHP